MFPTTTMNAKASKPYQFYICFSWVTSAVLRNVILIEGPVTCEVVRNPHSASDSEAVLPCVYVYLYLFNCQTKVRKPAKIAGCGAIIC